ncbi:LytR C-terminal domain-containing protein [Brachybacterium sp. p3-SID1565]|uniref:LytR C-terminal domain-containing protein n=1 Tax=Brachybacterium epidermidis TaxID=2781983 RepID=A0ABR9VZA0_9MICO|nr:MULTISPECIES: LytR C-terminal domain-containing protein [Brachybacterium]MBE9403521.1 LytR C-terminal domain-containing protein [Brachybacterium epidermidis]MCT1385335.1 LytR C-terminal domain-containing protein [Brachybacterium sp. p3-SID1565]
MPPEREVHPYGRSADEVRRRSLRTRRTRRLRITQLIVFSLLLVTLVAIGAYALRELREPPAEPGMIAPKTLRYAGAELVCPGADAVPLSPTEVQVTVLNGTGRSGFAGSITADLAERGYATGDPGNTSQASGPAVIVHGPEGYLAAQSLLAQVPGAQLRMDQREGTGVDLLLGDGFPGLAAPEAAQQALEQPVQPPEGC